MQIINAKSVFGPPLYKPDGKYGPYYTMTIEIPPDAPGVMYDDKYDRYYAYMNIDGEDEAVDELNSLSRGDEIQVAWNGSKYIPVSGSSSGGASTPTPSQSSGSKKSAVEPTSRHLIRLGLAQLGKETALVALDILDAVSADPRAEELSPDERLRLAITGLIQANRDANRELARAINLAEQSVIERVDVEGLPGSLLEAIASLLPDKYESAAEVAASLKELGLGSDDIDPENKETWLEMYRIAKSIPDAADTEPDADPEEELEGDGEKIPF